MSEVYLSADYVFPRTLELLHSDIDLLKVVPPAPTVHRDRDTLGDRTLHNMVLWPVRRGDFVMDDESEGLLGGFEAEMRGKYV